MLTDYNRLRQLFVVVRLADLNQIQNCITTLPQKFDHTVIIRVNIVINSIITIGSGDFLRFAVQSSSNTMTAVFLFDKDGFHPHNLAINTVNRIACVFAIHKSGIYWELGRKIFFYFLTSSFNVWLRYNAFI